MDLSRENDIERLRQAALILDAENKRLVQQLTEVMRELSKAKGEKAAALQLKLEELERQLALRNRALFGASSEKRPGPEDEKTAPSKKPQTGHGRKEQRALPDLEQVHHLDEADQKCTACGGELAVWEGQFEESEEIDVIARTFVLTKHKRQKYRCRCGGCIETALPPLKLFAGARYSIDVAVDIAISKYLDHLPLERQVRIMKREGLDIDSQTLWDYLDRLAHLLTPAHEALHEHILSRPVVGADETRWLLMGAPPGEKSKWQAWALSTAHAVCYRILDSRSAEAAREVLKGYNGTVVADGYSAYASLKKNGGAFRLAHCWAHVRRKYLECETAFPQVAEVLDLIAQLYAVEAQCGAGPPGEELRRQLRDTESRNIIRRIHEWALAQRPLPESGMGKAISYMGGLWPGLILFLDDPAIPIDNNATERAMRGPVVGRKNHYGSRSQRGTEVAALFYTLMESAKLNALDPRDYLRQAVRAALAGERIPLPHQIAAA
jgi:transposase